jgi:transglutaminase-like putative cysteine protease
MQTRIALRAAALLLFSAISALLQAQYLSLQPVNPDELKMTSDPKAPGADAVYLDLREEADDNLGYESHYVRIKVLTEKGKEMATINLSYAKGIHTNGELGSESYKITDIKGRTIHPDGTVIPLDVKPEDLLAAQTGTLKLDRKVFTLPSVEVGSVLEYMWTLRYPPNSVRSPTWDVQLPYFVHQTHFRYVPFKAFQPNALTAMYILDQDGDRLDHLIAWAVLPAGVALRKIPATGIFTLDMTDVPAAPEEDWMPPVESYLYKVRFYYIDDNDPSKWWLVACKRWDKRVNRFADPSKPIQQAVAQLVAPSDPDIVKAQKLYAAVQALENTDYTRAKSESERKELHLGMQKRAEDTLAQKSGSSNDIAMLYLAMLRAAGLPAYPAEVADRSERLFDTGYLSLDQLTDTLVILKNGDSELFLDPGSKMCPFGQLAWNHTATNGLRQDAKGFDITGTPLSTYSENTVVRTGDLALDSHGGVSGRLQIIMTGLSALYWRQQALENDETELKKQFDRELATQVPDGVEAHIDHFLGLDNSNANLMAVVKVSGSIGVSTAKRIMLPGYFFESRGRTPFVKEDKRTMAVDMHYGDVVTDRIVYHLPDGVTVEGAPQDADISWQGHAHYLAKSTSAAGQITIMRSLARAFSQAKPEEYQDLRGFYQKIAASDQGQLVLAAAPVSPAPAAQGH